MTPDEVVAKVQAGEAAKAAWVAGFQAARHYPNHPLPDLAIESDRDLNHGDDALIDLFWKVRKGAWPKSADLVPEFALAYGDQLAPMVMIYDLTYLTSHAEPFPPQAGGGTPPWHGPVDFLQAHLRCKIALKNEYGDRREIGETVPGEVSPPEIEP